jgi:hypothetical protein
MSQKAKQLEVTIHINFIRPLCIYPRSLTIRFHPSCLHHQSFGSLSMPPDPPDPLLHHLDFSPSYFPYTTPAAIAYPKAATDPFPMATAFPLVLNALTMAAPLLSAPCGVSILEFWDVCAKNGSVNCDIREW